MARHFNGTSDIAYITSFPLSGLADFSFSAWLKRDDNTQGTRMIFEYDQANGFDVIANIGGGKDELRSYSGAVTWADSYTTPSSGTWHHYAWIIPCNGEGSPPPASGLNQVWIDGTKQTLTTLSHSGVGSVAASGLFSWMGRRTGTTNSLFLGGSIAEWAMWSGSPMLNSNQIKALANGACPLTVKRDGMVAYVPYFGGDSPEPDYHGAQRSITISGTTTVNHPGVRSLVAFGQ